MSQSPKLKVQYGCGWSSVQGWVNFDSSPTLRLERLPVVGRFVSKNSQRFPSNVRYGDVTKRLPLPDGSASLLYCSHVLEHLALDDFRHALAESFRILNAGGVFRLVLPDLEAAINHYQVNSASDAAITFLESTILGKPSRAKGFMGFLSEWLGGSKHLWMWDFKAMKNELEVAGFKEVRRASFGDSSSLDFKEIEEESRWEGQLGVECVKASQSNPNKAVS